MASLNTKSILPVALLWMLVGCNQKVDFAAIGNDTIIPVAKTAESEVASANFKMGTSQAVFDQAKYDDNKTSISFQVMKSSDETINDLKTTDFLLTENGVPIQLFNVQSNSQQFVQTVDIVIALDVTGSMGPTIESVKNRITNFITSTRSKGYHTRMCLVTFGDYTVQKCNKFYDNDPNDPATMGQVQELISEVSKLRALKGAEDPGGKTLDENPLSAIIDSSIAPWTAGSQRFMILVTDAKFLYSDAPGNQGEIGAKAPFYQQALDALKTSQMNLFLVAPKAPGYNQTFNSKASLVTASNGEYFFFNDLVNGVITLDTVLNRIIQRVKTTYTANYTVDEIVGLNPSLPLSKRKISINLVNNTLGTVKVINLSTNLPEGKPVRLSRWKLTDKQVDLSSLKVLMNGSNFASGYKIENGELVFDAAPSMGARIEVEYTYALIKDSLLFEPLTLAAGEDLNSLLVMMNGKKATGADVVFEKSIEGNWTLRPSDRVLGESDPFEIRKNGGLNIHVIKITSL